MSVRPVSRRSGGSRGAPWVPPREMNMAEPELEATFPGTPPGVGQLRRAVAEIARRCGLSGSAVAAARLAASEAASNAVVHAYRDHPGDLRLLAKVEDGELHLVIADEGEGV